MNVGSRATYNIIYSHYISVSIVVARSVFRNNIIITNDYGDSPFIITNDANKYKYN